MKIIFIIVLVFLLMGSCYSQASKVEGTFWINLIDDWNMKDVNEEKKRMASARGEIIYFDKNGSFYFLSDLLDLFNDKTVGIDYFEGTTVGFFGEWKLKNNMITVSYKLIKNKHWTIPPSKKYFEKHSRKQMRIFEIKNNSFFFKIDEFPKGKFIKDKHLGLKVLMDVILNYFGELK